MTQHRGAPFDTEQTEADDFKISLMQHRFSSGRKTSLRTWTSMMPGNSMGVLGPTAFALQVEALQEMEK